jgi:hypothetical protein
MEFLSHYTNRAGLEGIVRSKSLWATNFLDLADKRELLYGVAELLKPALQSVLDEVSVEKKITSSAERLFEQIDKQLYTDIRGQVGKVASGHLYVTSFASHQNSNHHRRGIRSLWKQVGEGGYCLQFALADIKAAIARETLIFNYGLIELETVSYALDKSDAMFQPLLFQIAQRILCMIANARSDVGVEPQYERLWPEATFVERVLSYCARHKDPYFEDERECRIYAVPADAAASRFLTGIARSKKVQVSPSGKRYIEIGQALKGGIEPRRIIVGPRADREMESVLSGLHCRPELVLADFPE